MVPLLKQWMNMMRQSGNAEAESRFQAIKRHKGRAEFFTGLVAGTALELAPRSSHLSDSHAGTGSGTRISSGIGIAPGIANGSRERPSLSLSLN